MYDDRCDHCAIRKRVNTGTPGMNLNDDLYQSATQTWNTVQTGDPLHIVASSSPSSFPKRCNIGVTSIASSLPLTGLTLLHKMIFAECLRRTIFNKAGVACNALAFLWQRSSLLLLISPTLPQPRRAYPFPTLVGLPCHTSGKLVADTSHSKPPRLRNCLLGLSLRSN